MRTKTYTEQLEALYRGTKEGEESLSKLEFLSCYIFDFTTYDSGMDKIFVQKMLDVIECILNKTNFQYIEASNENYLNYLTMINMPFLKDKLDCDYVQVVVEGKDVPHFHIHLIPGYFEHKSAEWFFVKYEENEMQIFVEKLKI